MYSTAFSSDRDLRIDTFFDKTRKENAGMLGGVHVIPDEKYEDLKFNVC